MKSTIILILITLFFLVSCESKSDENSGETHEEVTPLVELPKTIENTDMIRKGVINADCDYYGRYETLPAGKFKQGQEILLMGYHYNSGFDVEVQVKTPDSNIERYVSEKNISRLDGVSLDLWCKEIMLTREYYYFGAPVEEIFNNDHDKGPGQDVAERERVIRLWRAFYSENRLYISDNFVIMGNDEDIRNFLLESVTKEGNIYTLGLSEYHGRKFDLAILVEEDGITLTHYVIKKGDPEDPIMGSLNYKYVPQDADKSKKTNDLVMAWCDEQIGILTRNEPGAVPDTAGWVEEPDGCR
jgi:hypothetical protein